MCKGNRRGRSWTKRDRWTGTKPGNQKTYNNLTKRRNEPPGRNTSKTTGRKGATKKKKELKKRHPIVNIMKKRQLIMALQFLEAIGIRGSGSRVGTSKKESQQYVGGKKGKKTIILSGEGTRATRETHCTEAAETIESARVIYGSMETHKPGRDAKAFPGNLSQGKSAKEKEG